MYTYFSAIPVLFALLLYFKLTFNVGQARRKYGVQAPAITGDAMFERTYRVQMNMLEQLIMFLPSVGIFAWVVSDRWSLLLGLFWVFTRLMYSRAYIKDPAKRHLWFLLGILVIAVFWVFAMTTIVRAIFFGKY